MAYMIPEKYRLDEEIIRLTVEQIQKDFGNLLSELIFSGDKAMLFKELSEQVAAGLKNIHKNNTAFRSLLYRVDITESDMKKIRANTDLESQSDNSYYNILAEKVVKREFQKVLTRKYFSKKDGNTEK